MAVPAEPYISMGLRSDVELGHGGVGFSLPAQEEAG